MPSGNRPEMPVGLEPYQAIRLRAESDSLVFVYGVHRIAGGMHIYPFKIQVSVGYMHEDFRQFAHSVLKHLDRGNTVIMPVDLEIVVVKVITKGREYSTAE